MYKLFLIPILLHVLLLANAQTPKGLTFDQYQLAKTFTIKDLDNDTYVKIGNTYVLDRYESKKPYFVTGDDGAKKRIDLYTLSIKGDTATLGTVIYYTNEKGKVYTACLPNNFADAKVWEQYFSDIHATEKTEPNYVLKLSYVLSREFSFQAYKSSLKGKEVDRSEAGTYGTDICFPGDEEVLMNNGSKKFLKDVKPGDEIITVDPATHRATVVKVKELVTHEPKNYAITQLTLVRAQEHATVDGYAIQLNCQAVKATPNHPILTKNGIKDMRVIREGEEVFCLNSATGNYESYVVWSKTESANGIQKVYNIEAAGGSTFIINGVMMMQKQQRQ